MDFQAAVISADTPNNVGAFMTRLRGHHQYKKHMVLRFYFVVLAFLVCSSNHAQQQLDGKTTFPAHPRLLLLSGQEKDMIGNIKTDAIWNKLHQTIIKESDRILTQPPVLQIKIGRRLLDKSRTCLLRVFYLSYSYRMTHEARYLKRAEAEMLAVAAFTDWNPTHFLDVGEMTMAMAIGYDWLYNDLPETSRSMIKQAILKKGIEPSMDNQFNSWLKSTNNWNQVCNTGISYGAIATYEDHPDLSIQIINRAITSMALPMQGYAPDGGYPEGYMYWEYGTSFNVMFISALQAAFGNDFGLSAKPGFTQTARFLENLSGTSGKPFDYADCIPNSQFNPAVFWFASKTNNNSLLWVEKKSLTGNDSIRNRLLPAAMIWGKGIATDKIPAPENNVWVGKGNSQVAMMRTSWTDPNAIFVGLKTGSPSSSHGHMDVGSFVMDANGERWAMDFGMQEYETLESKGIDLWNMKQESQRWQVFRYNNLGHNTLAVDNRLQQVNGNAVIIGHSSTPAFLNAVCDLTKIYDRNISRLKRGVAIINHKYVMVRDEVETKASAVTIRWSMVTSANVKIINDSTAELIKNGKKLLLKTQLPVAAKLKTWSTTPTNNYDAPNPGTIIIGFEARISANSKKAWSVLLLPQQAENKAEPTIGALSTWPKE